MTHPIAGADPLPDRPPGPDALLAELTAEQRKAVTHGTGPLLLLAGPGAGKTHTLTYRIAWLLANGQAEPWQILAVTFSVRLARFGAGLEQVRAELEVGRSLGHVVIATVTLPGGLIAHYQQLRDHSPSSDRRSDAERVLEDLRSLCRAAQAFEEQHEHPTLGGFLEHAAGLHTQELDATADRRITLSTIHRAKGSEAEFVVLLACEEQLPPSRRSLSSPDPGRLEEERRLFYVAAARAKDRLLITHVAERGRRP